MTIAFSPARWDVTIANYEAWWEGRLGRPLIVATQGRTPDVPAPELPFHHFTSFYDLSVSPERIMDVWEHHLASAEYFGDAFPTTWVNFGAGVIAAFMGCLLENTVHSSTTWFHPVEKKEMADLRFVKDDGNVWFRRVQDIMRAAIARFGGMAQIGMTDLGGNLDILSSFRPGEDLLLDLYDDPESVKARTGEAHAMWFRYFDDLNAILQPARVNPGYSCWTPLLSRKSYYMLQCDFCYMIGPDMFDEFVKPELVAACERLERPFYHLDGPGQLPHLDSLLEIERLQGVQWIPGAGAQPMKKWSDVYRKIHAAGKKIHLAGDAETLDIITDAIGSAEGIYFTPWGIPRDDMEKLFDRYGVPMQPGG